jgi:DNA-binding transcriptional LysR family regulator
MNNPPPDWDLCRSFLAILREGSLSAAGRLLGLAHPTVRRHLEALEDSLGAALFIRSPTGLMPTDIALALREPAEAMEAAFDQMLRMASGAGEAVAGTVRITASQVMGAEVLPPLLNRLRQRHPDLQFELELSDDLADLMRRDADLAVRMLRPTQGDLLARRVGQVRLGLYAHQSWVDRHGLPASFVALVQARQLIGYDRQRGLIDALAAQGHQLARGDFGLRSDSNLAQLAAMRAGLGVAICQAPLAARDRALVRLFPSIGGAMEIWLACHPAMSSVARVRASLDGIGKGIAAYCVEGV